MENPSGERHRAERAEQLKCLRERDADFLNRDVIQNVRHGDAGDGGDDENEIYMCSRVKWGVDFAEEQRQGQRKRGGNETDHAETANRAQLGGRTFHEDGVKRPAKCGGEGDEQPGPSNMSTHSTCAQGGGFLPVRLKPDHAERAEQSKQRSKLKLPLANDVALLRKKCEREQGGENYG